MKPLSEETIKILKQVGIQEGILIYKLLSIFYYQKDTLYFRI
ncbi:hypothetical protein ACQKNB_18990 [Lysinibacillus xylanilyticus]